MAKKPVEKKKKEEKIIYPLANIDEFHMKEDWVRLMPIISGNRRNGMIATMITNDGLLEPLSVLPEKVDGKWLIVDGMQRYGTILNEKGLQKIFSEGISYRVREELAEKNEKYLRWWILHHGGDRRHMTDYQIARWGYETAEADGSIDEAKERMAQVKGGKQGEKSATAESAGGETEKLIMDEYHCSRMPLRIYTRIKRLDPTMGDQKQRDKLWNIDAKLQLGPESDPPYSYTKAWEDLDKLEGLTEKPDKPKFFKSNTADLDEHAIEVEQAKERDELVEGKLYTPVHTYKESTDAEVEKSLGVTSDKIVGGGGEKVEEAKKIETDHEETMEALRADAEKWQEKAEELEKKLEADQSEETKELQRQLDMALSREKSKEDKKSENFKRVDDLNKELMEEIKALKAGKKVTDNPYFEHKFSSADVNELYAWLGEGLKAAMEKFGEPVGSVDVSVEFIPK